MNCMTSTRCQGSSSLSYVLNKQAGMLWDVLRKEAVQKDLLALRGPFQAMDLHVSAYSCAPHSDHLTQFLHRKI